MADEEFQFRKHIVMGPLGAGLDDKEQRDWETSEKDYGEHQWGHGKLCGIIRGLRKNCARNIGGIKEWPDKQIAV